jgi:thiol-disulfide isomerase/thioredoxin
MFARPCSNALSSSDQGGNLALKRNVWMRSDPLASRIAAWLAVLAIAIFADAKHDALAADRAPEFTHTSTSEWLNSKPLRLKNLRGQVVLIEFWAFDCVNCRRTVPWMHSMQDRYADQGLAIIGVHTPELPQERSAANVSAAVREQDITYPVMLDADYSYWNALSNRYWPAFYVVDARGNVAAQAIGEMHTGERRAAEFERQIEQLLRARTAATAP